MSQIRVHLADSDHFSRAGITAALSVANDIVVESVTDSMPDAIQSASELNPDIIILESSLEGLSLLEAIQDIAEFTPNTKVVVLASRYTREEIAHAYDAGSSGILSKSSISSELPSALRMLAIGYQLFAPPIEGWEDASRIGRRAGNLSIARELNERDQSLARLAALGLTNSQIARDLHISEGSVKLHLARIMDELDVRNRVQLAVIAAESGLVSSADLYNI